VSVVQSDLGWFWMSFMMVFWLVIVGVVIYVLVKLANRDSNRRPLT
jgi:flagellar biogenesis protein FliO